MSKIAVGAQAGPSIPLSRLHLHSSIPSHLSTELSFLHTLLLRARDQHRTQLFLRRMHEVLRVGKIVLRYVKESANDDSVRWEKRKRRGEQLVARVIRSLFTAQRFTAQIIELHHFVPLQTSVLAIYARLFAIILNIASGLGMDLEGLITNGCHIKQGKISLQRKRKIEDQADGMSEVSMKMDNPTDIGKLDAVNHMEIGGLELGEKIQRQPLTSISTSTKIESRRDTSSSGNGTNSSKPLIEDNPTASFSPARGQLAQTTKGPSPLSHAPSSEPERDDDVLPPELDTYDAEVKKKKKKKRSLDIDAIFDQPERKEGLARHVELDGPSVKKKTAPKEIGVQTGMPVDGQVKKKKIKKKKKDDMDDIFGF
ncbi:uncharacterized protein I303_100982 [Kwoniella dejecticola CBS 10117]|uniref:Nucleolus and neural progenitor protein-like N-terminal domain-containing protein n=1 Tax=Kwoniella dejecticola CBS 10117 TaxID=1296121 RepID=A0A1A6AGM5_9TREE|nr:uncharacterized protein I303_00986 [Kwoniella dejecticola CBS 10117]OBR89163.1 hypothetical protein I303_00986 [Kwoniella dejecticola CBS 10117]